MKSFVRSVLLIALAATGSAEAGEKVGNGGGAWVCRDSVTRDVKSAEFVDFFEAEREFALTVPRSSQPIDAQLEERLRLLSDYNPILHAIVKDSLPEIRTKMAFTMPGTTLAVVNDSLYRIRPSKPCAGSTSLPEYEQVINYTEDGRILVNSDLWAVLDNASKSGLLVHEAIYKALRDYAGAYTSVEARKMTGYLFSSYQNDSIRLVFQFSGSTELTAIQLANGTSLLVDKNRRIAAPMTMKTKAYEIIVPKGAGFEMNDKARFLTRIVPGVEKPIGSVTIQGRPIQVWSADLLFTGPSLSELTALDLREVAVNKQKILASSEVARIGLDMEGNLGWFSAKAGEKYLLADGQNVELAPNGRITLDANAYPTALEIRDNTEFKVPGFPIGVVAVNRVELEPKGSVTAFQTNPTQPVSVVLSDGKTTKVLLPGSRIEKRASGEWVASFVEAAKSEYKDDPVVFDGAAGKNLCRAQGFDDAVNVTSRDARRDRRNAWTADLSRVARLGRCQYGECNQIIDKITCQKRVKVVELRPGY